MKIWQEKNAKTNRKEWRANFVVSGRRHLPVASSRDELADIIDAIKRRARANKYGLEVEREVVTVKQLVAERSKDYDKNKKSHREDISVIERFRDYFDDSSFPVERLKQAHLRGFVQSLKTKNPKLKPATINRYLDAVNALLHSAERSFAALETWKPPRMPFESVPEGGRQRVITEEEQARLFFELRAPRGMTGGKFPRMERPESLRLRHTVADLLEFALMTGMRNTEARTLHRSKIDLTVKTVRDNRLEEVTAYGEALLTKTKTGRNRRVPLNRDARELLLRRMQESDCEWIFPNAAETRPIGETPLRRIMKRTAERAGVAYGQRTEDGFVFHDSRHTAATNMLQRGSDLKTIGAILGHSDETMTMRYSHDSAASRAHAVSSLERGARGGGLKEKRTNEHEREDK